MTPRSDAAFCIRDHTASGEHYAACPDYGNPEGATCPGCQPARGVDGRLLCDSCYRRLRFLLHSASDILGRMRTLALQGKAVVHSDVKRSGGSATAPDQVDADLLEAEHVITGKLRSWRPWIGHGRRVLDSAVSDEETARGLCADFLDQHPDGVEAAADWTLADAHARWGVERRDRYVYPAEDESEGVIIVTPVREWYDPLIPFADAAKRAGISERQLRNWMKEEILQPVAKLRTASVLRSTSGRGSQGPTITWFKASAVDAAAELMRSRRNVGRGGAAARELTPAGSPEMEG